ncbi:hypothetical protein [Brevibacterium litoralis]|uniref:hypothetical protein n=1 Tax=Brevibacterium litoralis TaxID=3138935 RepID=UPI0032EFA872
MFIDSATALNPHLPPIRLTRPDGNTTPVIVLTTRPDQVRAGLSARDRTYDVVAIPPLSSTSAYEDVAHVFSDIDLGPEEYILFEGGPALGFALLRVVPGAELQVSVSPVLAPGPGPVTEHELLHLDLTSSRIENGQFFGSYTRRNTDV